MADINNIYRVTPRRLRDMLKKCFYAGLVPYVRASPGTGKSSVYKQVFKELNLWMIDHRISTSESTDFSGLPHFVNGKARFAPFDELFPIEGTPIPEGKDGWGIFLDEFNSGLKPVQAAAYKLLLDKMTGQHPLHERVVIGLAGNLDTDRAITTMTNTALQSRVVHFELDTESSTYFKEFMEDVVIGQWDGRVMAYLNQYPSKLMDFRPDHNEKTFCCPRTWEFISRLLTCDGKPATVSNDDIPLFAGTITSGVAVDFVNFCQVYLNLINVRQILRDPRGIEVPYNADLKWATITHMTENVTDETFDDLCTYANRFSMDYRVLFYRSAMVRHSHLRQHPAFARSMSELSRYLTAA